MTEVSLSILMTTAVTIALLHTFIGVDHYLPFVVLGRAKNWSVKKVLGITAVCGLGHVVISIVLGFAGIGAGMALDHLEWIEGIRGSLAAWALIGFGAVYAAYSFVRAQRGKRHSHAHMHEDGTLHTHEHDHANEHMHAHEAPNKTTVTVWSLFIIFVLGPCEPLIPLLMAPAWEANWMWVAAVALVFSVVTIGTMVFMAYLGTLGLRQVSIPKLERHANTLAGLAIATSGLMIQVLGI